MTLQRGLYYIARLIKNVFSLRGLAALLSSFGALWLVVEILDYFFRDTRLAPAIQAYWWVFGGAGIVIALRVCRPVLSVTCKLKDRDVAIEIAIGDLFSFPGAVVVGSNSTFDTRISREMISEQSIQGQFTRRYYGDEVVLDRELDGGLNGQDAEELKGRRIGKSKRYPIGTVVRLNPKDRRAYFVAIAHINEHGVASGTFEDLKQSVAKLWTFLGERGLKEPVVMPVLGSGFSRLAQPRQIIVQEVIKSFVAACSEKTFCEKLTIVLAEADVLAHQVDLEVLGDFVSHTCMYTEFASPNAARVGTPTG